MPHYEARYLLKQKHKSSYHLKGKPGVQSKGMSLHAKNTKELLIIHESLYSILSSEKIENLRINKCDSS